MSIFPCRVKSTFIQVVDQVIQVDLTDDIPSRSRDVQITLGRVTPTIPHLAKGIGLLCLYLVSLMVIVGLRVSYGYEYTRGSGRRGRVG